MGVSLDSLKAYAATGVSILHSVFSMCCSLYLPAHRSLLEGLCYAGGGSFCSPTAIISGQQKAKPCTDLPAEKRSEILALYCQPAPNNRHVIGGKNDTKTVHFLALCQQANASSIKVVIAVQTPPPHVPAFLPAFPDKHTWVLLNPCLSLTGNICLYSNLKLFHLLHYCHQTVDRCKGCKDCLCLLVIQLP